MFCTIPRSCHGRPQYRMIYVSYCKHWASTATRQPTRIGGAPSRNGWKATMCLPPTDCPRHRKSNARNRFWIDEQPIDQMTAFISSGPSPRYGAMSELRDKTVTHNFGKTVGLRLDPFVLLYAHTGASTVYRRSPSIRAYGKPCRFLTVQSPASELSMSNDLRHNTPK